MEVASILLRPPTYPPTPYPSAPLVYPPTSHYLSSYALPNYPPTTLLPIILRSPYTSPSYPPMPSLRPPYLSSYALPGTGLRAMLLREVWYWRVVNAAPLSATHCPILT
eukprot:2742136-Rhodomonas_salina.1